MSAPDTSNSAERSWSNFYSGLIWYVLGFLIIVGSQIIAGIVLVAIETLRAGTALDEAAATEIFLDGDIIGIAFPIGMVAIIATVSLLIKYRRKRDIAEYLALNNRSLGVIVRWLKSAALILGLCWASGIIFNRPDVPEWVEKTYCSLDYKFLFFFALVICAPILEEVLYRGYILRAWMESKLDPTVAVVLLSVLWAATHLQYDLYDMFWVFVLGLFLAYARLRSGSLYPAIAIHSAWNLAAFLAMEYHLA